MTLRPPLTELGVGALGSKAFLIRSTFTKLFWLSKAHRVEPGEALLLPYVFLQLTMG